MENYIKKISNLNIDECLDLFKANKRGLTDEEVIERREKYGKNVIEKQKIQNIDIFVKQFKNPFIYLLVFAALFSLFFSQLVDVILIIIFIVIGILIGFYYEHRSNNALSLLTKFLKKDVRARRSAIVTIIKSEDLVPGDIILIEAGDIVPADIKLIKSYDLEVDESSFTGEAEGILKKEGDICFSGSSVAEGDGEGIVFSIGKDTYFGKIGKFIEGAQESAFSREIGNLAKFFLRFVLIIAVLLFITNLIIKGFSANTISDFLVFVVAVIVAVVPESLPMVVNATLARGALRMAEKKVVVRKLSSIEDLGNIEILCTDKTGTLTENKLQISEYWGNKNNILKYFSLASPLLSSHDKSLKKKYLKTHSFDEAVLREYFKTNSHPKNYMLLEYLPFNPFKRYDASLVELEKSKYIILRGAPEKILSVAKSLNISKKGIKNFMVQEGKIGRRVLALAYIKTKSKLIKEDLIEDCNFLGLISFQDPLKVDAKSSIKLARDLGIDIKILTGDAENVSFYVANNLGLIDSRKEIISGQKFSQLSHKEKTDAVINYRVFARVDPFQKYEIVELLKKKFTVGFVGDGINDSAALKIADVGIAVKGAADISEEISDIIVLKKSLSVIIDGINEGRQVFANTIKYLKVTLSANLGNFFSLTGFAILLNFLPMLGTQVLLLNFLTDLPLVLIGFDRVDPEETKKPKNYSLYELGFFFVIFGIVSSMFDFIFYGFYKTVEPQTFQTLWFVFSTITEIVIIFSLRTRKIFFKAYSAPKTLYFLSAVVIFLTIYLPFNYTSQEIFDFVRPHFQDIIIIGILTLVYFFINELVKNFYYLKDIQKVKIKTYEK